MHSGNMIAAGRAGRRLYPHIEHGTALGKLDRLWQCLESAAGGALRSFPCRGATLRGWLIASVGGPKPVSNCQTASVAGREVGEIVRAGSCWQGCTRGRFYVPPRIFITPKSVARTMHHATYTCRPRPQPQCPADTSSAHPHESPHGCNTCQRRQRLSAAGEMLTARQEQRFTIRISTALAPTNPGTELHPEPCPAPHKQHPLNR
jgi:hypothetical protein